MVMYSSFGSRLIDQIKLIAQKLANKGHGPTSEEEEVVVWWWWVVMMFPRGIGLSYQLISSLLVGSIDDPMKSTDRPTDQIF